MVKNVKYKISLEQIWFIIKIENDLKKKSQYVISLVFVTRESQSRCVLEERVFQLQPPGISLHVKCSTSARLHWVYEALWFPEWDWTCFLDTCAVRGWLYRWPIHLWSGCLCLHNSGVKGPSQRHVTSCNIIKVFFWNSCSLEAGFNGCSLAQQFGMWILTPRKYAFC